MVKPILHLFGFNNHRAKLVKYELSATQATTDLAKDHRTRRRQLHQKCRQAKQRSKHDQSKGRSQEVEDVFDEQYVLVFGRRGNRKKRQILQCFEINFRSDVREKTEHNPSLYPLFLADEKDFLQTCQGLFVHHEDHFVHYVVAQHFAEPVNVDKRISTEPRIHGLDFRHTVRSTRHTHKPVSPFMRFFQCLGNLGSFFASPNDQCLSVADENVGELPDSCLRRNSECTQKEKIEKSKNANERAADEFILQNEDCGTNQDRTGKDGERDLLYNLKPVLRQSLLS